MFEDAALMEQCITETIEAIARRGQYTSQNIDIMTSILSNIRTSRSDKEITSLLHIVSRVALLASTCTVSFGRYYPDSLIKTILDEFNNTQRMNPFNRELLLQIIEELIQGESNNNNAAAASSLSDNAADAANNVNNEQQQQQQQQQIQQQEQQQADEKKNKPLSSNKDNDNTKTTFNIAVLSKKHRDEIHASLFRALAKDVQYNETGNFVEIFRALKCMLQQYRNKDLETSVPFIFRIQELTNQSVVNANSAVATPPANSTYANVSTPAATIMSIIGGNGSGSGSGGGVMVATPMTSSAVTTTAVDLKKMIAVHSIVALYLLALAKLYSSKALEKYVVSVIEQRIEQQQISPIVLSNLDEILTSASHYLNLEMNNNSTRLLRQIFDYSGSNATNISTLSTMALFNPEIVIDILCQIESIKQSYDNVRETLSTVYTAAEIRMGMMHTSRLLGQTGRGREAMGDDDVDSAYWKMYDDEKDVRTNAMDNDANTDSEYILENMQQQRLEKASDIVVVDYIKLGDFTTVKVQESRQALLEIIKAIPFPTTMGNEDHRNDISPRFIVNTGTQQRHSVSTAAASSRLSMNPYQHSSSCVPTGVAATVPPLYLFDTPEFLSNI